MSSNKLSLKDQIALLNSVAPESIQDPDAAATVDSGRDHYLLPSGKSELRTKADNAADRMDGKVYGGKVVTRQKIFDDDPSEKEEDSHAETEDSQDEDEDDVVPFGQVRRQSDDDASGSEGQDDSESEEGDEDEGDEDEEEEEEQEDSEEDGIKDVALLNQLRERKAADIIKGTAVKKQIAFWDETVGVRISLQKVLKTVFDSNPSASSELQGEQVQGLTETVSALKELSEQIFIIREALDENESVHVSKKRKIEQDPRNYLSNAMDDDESIRNSQAASSLEILNKWSAKLQMTNTASNSNKFKAVASSAPEQIAEQLRDMPKLRQRTQLRLTGEGLREADPSHYDDADFYQVLLREMIDRRSGKQTDAADLNLSGPKFYPKIKRSIDTKASKGRKLRYTLIPQLQAFMVPVPLGANAWHEQQASELFSSLLGAGFDDDDGTAAGAQLTMSNGKIDGLSLFG